MAGRIFQSVVHGSYPQLVVVRGGRATIDTLGRYFINFVVVSNVKSVGGFHLLERSHVNVSIDGLKFENDEGSEGNLFIMKVSKIVKFQGTPPQPRVLTRNRKHYAPRSVRVRK